MGGLLFDLYNKGLRNLKGFDISPIAISKAKEFSKKNNIDIEFEELDLTKEIPEFTDCVIFTHTCMEQLKNYMNRVIKNIINSNPKVVLNFELDYQKAPLQCRLYFKARDFQDNLVTELEKNNVEFLKREPMRIGISPKNLISKIVWKPNIFKK